MTLIVLCDPRCHATQACAIVFRGFYVLTVYFPENLRDMRLFIAVYEERSFTAAAEREKTTQSGVSQHIRRLEKMLGAQLLTRKAGIVLPTPAGEVFYAGYINIIKALDKVRQNLEAFEGGLEGSVRLGLTPTIARSVLAPALSRFVSRHPNVVVHISEEYSAAIADRLNAGELDVALVPAMPQMEGIIGRLVIQTPEYIVASHATAGRLGLRRDAASFPEELKLVMPSRAQPRRALLDRYISTTGLNVQLRLELDSMFGTLDFVATTDWVTILPAIMLSRNLDRRLVTIPLRNPPLLLDIFRIENRRLPISAAAYALIECFEEEARTLQDEIERTQACKTTVGPRDASRQ